MAKRKDLGDTMESSLKENMAGNINVEPSSSLEVPPDHLSVPRVSSDSIYHPPRATSKRPEVSISCIHHQLRSLPIQNTLDRAYNVVPLCRSS